MNQNSAGQETKFYNQKSNDTDTKVLIVSPHPDDAAFSLGGSILKNPGYDVTVWNIFSEKRFNVRKIPDDVIQNVVIDEELKAAGQMGVKVLFGGYKDAQLRGYNRLSDILGMEFEPSLLKHRENDLFFNICDSFAAIYDSLNPEWVGVCMGSGFHIDHVMAREVVLESFGKKDFNVFFYEDQPYSHNKKWREDALNYLQKQLRVTHFDIDISDYVSEKEKLLKIYFSQIKDRDCAYMIKYAHSIKENTACERIWAAHK